MDFGAERILETILVGALASLCLLSLMFLFFGHVLRVDPIRRIARFALYEERLTREEKLTSDSGDKQVSFAFLLLIALLYGLGATVESITHETFVDKELKSKAFAKVCRGQVQGQTAPIDFSRFVTDDLACKAAGIDPEEKNVDSPCHLVYQQEREYYYTAKNAVFQKESFSNELVALESRIDFVRASCLSLALLAMTTLLATIIAGLCELAAKRSAKVRRGDLAVSQPLDDDGDAQAGDARDRWAQLKQHWKDFATLRCFMITLALGALSVVAWYAWRKEETQYSRRIFGYYLSLVGGRRAESTAEKPVHVKVASEEKPAGAPSVAVHLAKEESDVVLTALPTSPYRVFAGKPNELFDPSAIHALEGGPNFIVANDRGGEHPFLLFTRNEKGLVNPTVLALVYQDGKSIPTADLVKHKFEVLFPFPKLGDKAGRLLAIAKEPSPGTTGPGLATLELDVDFANSKAIVHDRKPIPDPCGAVKQENPHADSCSIEGAATRDGDYLLLGVRYLLGPAKNQHTPTLVIAGVSRSAGAGVAPDIILKSGDDLPDHCNGFSGVSDIQVLDEERLLVLTSFELRPDDRCPASPKDLIPIAQVGGALWLVQQQGRGEAKNPTLVQKFAHKPEGVTRLKDGSVLVVFDDDAHRKSLSHAPDTFPLEHNEAVYTIVHLDKLRK